MDARPEDLRWFAENLEINQFKALSQGLGLGELTPKRHVAVQQPQQQTASSKQRPMPAPQASQTAQGQQQQYFQAENQLRAARHREETPSKVNKARRLRWPISWRRLEAIALDALMVATAVAFALALAALVSALKNGVNSNGWIDLSVLKWVRQFALAELSAMMGGLLALYYLVFKVAIGQTVGENLSGCLKDHKDFLGYEASRTKSSL